jgi:hypothetical protein
VTDRRARSYSRHGNIGMGRTFLTYNSEGALAPRAPAPIYRCRVRKMKFRRKWLQGLSHFRIAAMQQAKIITPRLMHTSGGLVKLYRKGVLKIWYVKLEVLDGLYVLIHRFNDHSAIFIYNSGGKKVFRYYVSKNDLNEFFTMLEYFTYEKRDQQFVIGRFGFRIKSAADSVSIGVEYLSHDVEILGARSLLEAAIVRYRSLHRSRRTYKDN